MAKANVRLRTPSSHTRLLSRIAVGDVIWGGVSPLVAYLLRDGAILRPGAVATYCGVALLASLLVFQWFRTSTPISRFYSIRDAFELLKACVVIAALSAAASFLLTRLDEAPRSIPVLHLMLMASVLLGGRILVRSHETRRQASPFDAAAKVEHVLIIQASRLAWFFSRMVEELAPGGYQIVAVLDERTTLQHRSLNGYPIVGTPVDLERIIANYATHGVRIDKIVVAAPPEDFSPSTWNEIQRVCGGQRIDLELLPERLLSRQPKTAEPATSDLQIDGSPTVANRPSASAAHTAAAVNRSFWKIKRVIDLVVACALSVVVLPVALVVCAVVVLDVGIPVVFWQRRVGRAGTPLYLYKFRTLPAHFDVRLERTRGEKAISPVGRFLRATRLDELPQLWNVLSGEMSLIGPRPLLPVDQPSGRSLRLAVRPGVTGWAQVCGGKLISVEEKNALDEWYIRHASLRLDLLIVVRTALTLAMGDRRDESAISIAIQEMPDRETREGVDEPRKASSRQAGTFDDHYEVVLKDYLSYGCR